MTGTLLKAAIGGQGGGGKDQFLLLTTTGIYAWGPEGIVLDNALTSSIVFAKIVAPTGSDTATRLPAGVSPSSVVMFFATNQTLAILTDSGYVWILTQAGSTVQGDSTAKSTTTWHKVKKDASTYLNKVIAIRGNVDDSTKNSFLALTSDGKIYAWGATVFPGGGAARITAKYARQLAIPSEFGVSNVPKMIAVTGGSNDSAATNPTYYIVSYFGGLYCMGDNRQRQCGDFTTTVRLNWVKARFSSATSDTIKNVSSISVQEHTAAFPAVAVVTDTGNIYAWGDNSSNMLGSVTTGNLDPHIPGGFTPGTDKALFAETGGHTLVYVKQGSTQFCYVGHATAGSAGNTDNTTYPTFNCSSTPVVSICGSVPVVASLTTSTISATPTSILANGVSTSTITVQLKTAAGVNLTSSGGSVSIFTTSGTIGTVIDNNNGTYTAVLTSSNVVSTATLSFTINGYTASATTNVNFTTIYCAPPITGVTTMCVGANVLLSDATPGGTWLSNATGIATVGTTGAVSGVSAGTALITYSLNTGCIATATVTVNANPSVITGVLNACSGSGSILYDTVAGGSWSSGAPAVATVGSSTGIVVGVSSGTAIITYSLSTGCLATVVYTVNPLPLAILGTTNVAVGSSVTLTNATSGGVWASANTGVATVGSTGSVTGVATGTTTISYTLATGCYAVTTFTVTSASVTPPSISAQPVSQYGCIGYRSIFSVTASPSTGGHTLSYAWRKSGVNITGATNSVYIIHSVANTDTGTSIYSCVITDNQDGGTATSINVSLILNKQAVFNGATNSWTTGSNWSTGAQPDSTIHAYIPATAVTMPNVTTGTVRCKCLTIESGASLTVNGGAIEIAGRINNSGTFTATNGAITLNGTTVAQTIPAATFYSNTIKELQVANSVGVSLGGALRLTGTYTPTSGVFASGGFLTLASSSAGTANVARGSAGGGYITGDVIVERYMPANSHRAWRLLAPTTVGAQTLKSAWQEGASTYPSNPAPGYGTLITCSSAYSRTAGFDTITAQQSVQLWDITNQSWTTRPLTNTNTKIYSSEPGYFIYLRGDRTVSPSSSIVGSTPTVLRSKGALRMGDQAAITVPVSKGVLVGNPYASAIDFSLISPADRPNLPKRFWLWDPVLTGTSGLGAYVIFDSTTSTPWMPSVTGGSYSAPNSIIPSGMAFLLQPGVATGTITLRESHKVNSHSNVGFKQNNIHTRELHIGLAAAGPDGLLNNADGIFALYKDLTAAEVDDDDAVKMVNPGENIALSRDGHDLAIEARPDMNADDTLFIKMWNMVNKAYRLTFKPANFGNSGKTAVLHDRYLNTTTPVSLESATKYDFEVSGEPASASATRFYIVYQSKNGYNDNINAGDIAVYPNPAENYKFTLLVNYADAAEYEISLLNGSGVSVHNEKYVLPTTGKLEKPISLHKNVPSGNYILVVGKNGKQYKSVNVVIK